jgi:HSP20 family protein
VIDMNMRDLMPWSRSESQSPNLYREYREAGRNPFFALHREMNRLFDDALRGLDSFGRFSSWGGWPDIEVSETDNEIKVTAEVPGLEEKDIDVTFDGGMLSLRGEKRSESEDNERQFSERFYGRFERRVPLDAEIDQDKVEATFKNGVLTVTLAKTTQAQSKAKRIAINKG